MNYPAVLPHGIKESDICIVVLVIPACRESFRKQGKILDKRSTDLTPKPRMTEQGKLCGKTIENYQVLNL